jgi:hypothetical protein
MKHILFALFAAVAILGCATEEAPPSQFEATERQYRIRGCEDLKQSIDQHNKSNPDQHIIADC